ncbi:MAG: hypothetical protein ABI333_18030 [bacterium]
MIRRSIVGFAAIGIVCLLAAPVAWATPNGSRLGGPDTALSDQGGLIDIVMTRQLSVDGAHYGSSAYRVLVAQGEPPPPPPPPPGAAPGGHEPHPGYGPHHGYAPRPYQPQPQVYAPSKGLMIAGWIMFGVSYIVAIVTGAAMLDLNEGGLCGVDCKNIGGSLLIPVAGPFIAMGWSGSHSGRIMLALWGAVELAGVLMGVIGTVKYINGMKDYNRAKRRRQYGGIPVTDHLSLTAGFMPTRDGAATKVGVVYEF